MPDPMVCPMCGYDGPRHNHTPNWMTRCDRCAALFSEDSIVPLSAFLRKRIASDLERLGETGAEPTDAERFARLPEDLQRGLMAWKQFEFLISCGCISSEAIAAIECNDRLEAAALIAALREDHEDASS
jgi:hypothetical protein